MPPVTCKLLLLKLVIQPSCYFLLISNSSFSSCSSFFNIGFSSYKIFFYLFLHSAPCILFFLFSFIVKVAFIRIGYAFILQIVLPLDYQQPLSFPYPTWDCCFMLVLLPDLSSIFVLRLFVERDSLTFCHVSVDPFYTNN